jgi:hypothetical protein
MFRFDAKGRCCTAKRRSLLASDSRAPANMASGRKKSTTLDSKICTNNENECLNYWTVVFQQ